MGVFLGAESHFVCSWHCFKNIHIFLSAKRFTWSPSYYVGEVSSE